METTVRRSRAILAVIGLSDGKRQWRWIGTEAQPATVLANQPEWMTWLLTGHLRGPCVLPLDPG